ncbi:sugar transferase [Flavobacteriaceae bacterium 14752]|uniref:sugar transferase n=1 Tax=Mesohalobacter salilacus TaxID=2491711 RepID=UPI000F63CCA5|nr:sugar transferase [Flavobacteriaceae bacterium 14752]
MNRLFDFIFSLLGILLLLPVMLLLLIIAYFDSKKPLFIQERVGKNKEAFKLVKFRTMHLSTKSVASHLADVNAITKFGSFLRKTKLDELPQLINVLKGDMSLVGPRPNLFNQLELIEEREKRGVYDVLPGITGLSQINNIDMSTPKELAISDAKMIKSFSLKAYFYFIFTTLKGKGKGDVIK